jgi:hypothetical protein
MAILKYCLIVLLLWSMGCSDGRQVPIVIAPSASSVEQIAAEELSGYLEELYDGYRFPVMMELPQGGPCIAAGVVADLSALGVQLTSEAPTRAESYVVTQGSEGDRDIGIIAGADSRGVLYGVYGLLEKLGYGFYLSYETQPEDRPQQFDFSAWDVTDAPLTGDRIVFNWHNFISGCSTWNLEDWEEWIVQSSKMRYNGIMVHAYGNNPMMSFAHNGETKPVGYLANSYKGRDWGTSHVNDVRRLHGGSLFNDSVFGADASRVPDADVSDTAVQLMQQVFTIAEDRGMDVTFALDVCTEQVNPQNIIMTLPEAARFYNPLFNAWLPNPDTPEGYAYFKSRIASLLEKYSQIDRLALWFRGSTTQSVVGSPWRSLQPEYFPAQWQREYNQALQQTPNITNDPESPSLFAIAKIAKAAQIILQELGRDDVTLAGGSWRFSFPKAFNRFMPDYVTMMPLDYSREFDTPEIQQKLAGISAKREVLPIVWAHHDDRYYITRPYTPFNRFQSLLEGSGSGGYGIIHWMNRPLDLYFKSLAEQVWTNTRDIALQDFCEESAADIFGAAHRAELGAYLQQWLEKGPQFGRETMNYFIDKILTNAETDITECKKRIAMLQQVDRDNMSQQARDHWEYLLKLEEFAVDFLSTHQLFERAQALKEQGDYEGARAAIDESNPGAVLEKWADCIAVGRTTKGELGLLVSMNTRWYPYYVAMKQALRAEPVRYNFQTTRHEALAQRPGINTWFIDRDGALWQGLGEQETGIATFAVDGKTATTALDEIEQTGIRIDNELQLSLSAIAGEKLIPGWYRVSLLLPPNQQQRTLKITLKGGDAPKTMVAEELVISGTDAGETSLDVYVDAGAIDCKFSVGTEPVSISGIIIAPVTR